MANSKIKVFHHVGQLGLGGTEKTAQIFAEYLNPEVFEVFVLAPKFPVKKKRIIQDKVKAFLGSKKAAERLTRYGLFHSRLPEFQKIVPNDHLYLYENESELVSIFQKHQPDILHVHHAGSVDGPFLIKKINSLYKHGVSTNIFAEEPTGSQTDKISKILFVSEWLMNSATWKSAKAYQRTDFLYNPVHAPLTSDNWRSKLNISNKTFVFGRIGRNADDIYDSISLRAYKKIENENTLFLVVAAPPKMKEDAAALNIKYIQFIEPQSEDIEVSKFYNTIDALAHARLDGETFGCVIAEAMIHAKPVISHHSHIRNAQSELILEGQTGFVVNQNDDQAYAVAMNQLVNDKNLYVEMCAQAKNRALKEFSADALTKKLEQVYLDLLRR